MIVLCLLIIIYLVYLLELIFGLSLKKSTNQKSLQGFTHFTILIPFHDEFQHLPHLIQSLNVLDYSKNAFEVIFIDDSPQKELVIVNAKFDYQVIQNQRISASPKKDALTLGVQLSKNDWIVTTDADCLFPKDWLKIYSANTDQKSLLVGSVCYHKETGFLKDFQFYDFLSLQGVTASTFNLGKPFMCNGANLTFQKSLFYKVGGYEDNDHIASGDDVFLLQKVLKYDKSKIHYLGNENVVHTFSVDSWQNLYKQRVRWGKKAAAYKMGYPKFLGLFIFLGNIVFYPLIVLSFMNPIGFLFVGLKILVDEIFLSKSVQYFHLKKGFTLHFSFFYPIFLMLVLLKMVFGENKWK